MDTILASSRLELLPKSVVKSGEMEFALAHEAKGLQLAVLGPSGANFFADFNGNYSDFNHQTLLLGNLNPQNAASLRTHLPWLRPKVLGIRTSAGMGDRLGIATPGQVRAVQEMRGKIAPIFAQQSIREMNRTGRTPQQVMDNATWGIFEEGWQAGVGADADHLKTTEDIDACLSAGFTFFTIDPGYYVDNAQYSSDLNVLNEKANLLPHYLHARESGLLDRVFDFEGYRISVDEYGLLTAAVKYGNAIAHVVQMYDHLQHNAQYPFEVEISMDETELPTSPFEHIYIVNELRRLGVKWVSFAPRFVGRFEKGVDYIGDLEAFAADISVHAAIARNFGPYKISLHSGSDKFSIYPIFMEKTQGLAHLKTAGTSYLEALRTIATLDKEFIKEIYLFAREHFEQDKHSYLSSASIVKAPKPDEIDDWSCLFDQFDAREIFHVTYGSVLTEKFDGVKARFYDHLITTLRQNRELYFQNLQKHFKRHLLPFSTL